MKIYMQRPYLMIHSNYPEIDTSCLRAYPTGNEVCVEIWAEHNKELGIEIGMMNGVQAYLTVEQAKKLRDRLNESLDAISKGAEN